MSSLKVTGLVKHFDDVVAVDGLDLEVKKGEFFLCWALAPVERRHLSGQSAGSKHLMPVPLSWMVWRL